MSTESKVAEQTAEDENKKNEQANSAENDAGVENEHAAAAEAVAEEVTSEETVAEETDDDGSTDTPKTAAEPTEAEIIESLRSELAEAQAQSEELTDKLQRTAAEFQNSRRRQEKRLADEIERASSHLIQRIFPVVDDLELAFSNLPTDLDETENAWVDGFRQIQKKLETLLDDQGVSVVANEGEFDPTCHEAISSEPSDTVESGHIIQTLRTGYEYKGRVLRPALVRVAT